MPAASQDPRKEDVNLPNLFPDEVALRLDEAVTAMVDDYGAVLSSDGEVD